MFQIYFCTTPVELAEEIARALVEERLAACVNILPRVRSVYRWKQAVESDDEALLVIKSRAALFGPIEAALRHRHPYEVFELIALDISQGNAPYLDWLADVTRAGDED